MRALQRLARGFCLALLPAALAAAQPNVEAAVSRWFRPSPGGVAVAYVDREGAVFATRGQFAPRDPRPITADTSFEIGSVTKVFTALLLVESEKAGKAKRTAPAAKFLLPASDPDAKKLGKITLVSLATHSAGLPRMAPNFTTPPGGSRAGYTQQHLLEGFRHAAPGAKVGGKSVYSNFGVALLGQALAAAWGMSYPDALQQPRASASSCSPTPGSCPIHWVFSCWVAPLRAAPNPQRKTNERASQFSIGRSTC